MMSLSDPHSKHYSRAACKSQFESKVLSRSFPNVLINNNGSQGDSNKVQKPAPKSMRTFRSRFDEGGGEVRAVESKVFSGPIEKNQTETWFSRAEENEKKKNSGAAIEGSSMEGSSSMPMRVSAVSCVGNDDDVSLDGSSSYLADETNSLDLSMSFSDFSAYSSDISGELQRLASLSSVPVFPQEEAVSQSKWVGRFVKSRNLEGEDQSRGRPHVSTAAATTLSDSLGPETLEVIFKSLVEDLESTSIELQRNAAAQLRLHSKNKMENRIIIANAGAIKPLVSLLRSTDPQAQEYGVTALLNLSLYENNKSEITAAGAIKPLIYVLKTGTSTAKENAACTLLSLSLIEDNKITIGAAGAIPPLVALLINGSFRGKKDAATTLYTLSSVRENKDRAIRAGAIRPLVDLMADPSTGMVDKAAVVLGNLANIPEGKTVIVDEGGIPVLVEVVEVGSQKGKEYATATLLQLCEDNFLCRTLVSREGAIPPLVALSQSGTARAKQKAVTLLRYLREPRQGSLREQHSDFSSS